MLLLDSLKLQFSKKTCNMYISYNSTLNNFKLAMPLTYYFNGIFSPYEFTPVGLLHRQKRGIIVV